MKNLRGYKNQFFNMYSCTWVIAPIESIDWFLGNFDLDTSKELLVKINSERTRHGKKPFYPDYGHRLF